MKTDPQVLGLVEDRTHNPICVDARTRERIISVGGGPKTHEGTNAGSEMQIPILLLLLFLIVINIAAAAVIVGSSGRTQNGRTDEASKIKAQWPSRKR